MPDWSPLLQTTIGGLLAIAGGVASQWALHVSGNKRERRKLMTEKAEEIFELLHENEDWISDFVARFKSDTPTDALGMPTALRRAISPTNALLSSQNGSNGRDRKGYSRAFSVRPYQST